MNTTHPKNYSAATRALIILAVMSATLMQVLDTTIVNVALPHMQGSLGSTSDEVTWVLTSYLVASAIFMPLTGYFTDRLGRKNYLLISIAGFVLTSALCGAAVNITQIVLFRLLQGAFGAALVPLSQAIMTDVFPEEERGTAMAIWGMGVMVGPILGPTLGGYLTEIASWRWNFYINIPFGIASLFLAWRYAPDTPKKQRSMDWVGLILISTAIGATQYFFDRGNSDDWFNSSTIRLVAFLAVMSLLGFILHGSIQKNKSVFDLKIFNDRNFTCSSIILAMFGLGLYGGMVMLPLMLENLLNYPVITAGFAMAPRGIAGLISMIVVSKLIKLVDPRILIATGIFLSIIGTTVPIYYNLNVSPFWIIFPVIIQGFGLGMIFVPLSAMAFSTLPAHSRAEAAGLFSLLRTLGSSIGISVVVTTFSRHTQIAWNQLGGFINPYNAALTHYLQVLHTKMTTTFSMVVIVKQLARQAQMVSFVNVYSFITWSFVAMLPMLLFLRKSKQKEIPVEIVE